MSLHYAAPCRCKRPKLALLADLLLKRERLPADTFCAYQDITDEAVRALEG